MSDTEADSQESGDAASTDEPPPQGSTGSDVEQPAVVAWWQRLLQAFRERVSTWPGVASIAIAFTVVGSWAPWSVDGRVRLGGLEGSHDGWLAALYALAALAAVKSLTRRSWPATVVMLICGVAVLRFTLGDAPPPGSAIAWGWWLTLIGGLGIVSASVGTTVARVRGEAEQRWVSSTFSLRRTALGAIAIASTIALFLVFVQVLFVPERVSWPPPADAITAEQARPRRRSS